jgi:hypothetical protein
MDLTKRCLRCDREVGWLARQIHESFCCSECSTKYRKELTTLAVERLNASGQASEKAMAATFPDAF